MSGVVVTFTFQLKPEWDQDLSLNITIPPGEIQDIQQWVDRQVIQISLLDYEDSGVVPHTELIAVSYIPLVRVLLSARKPIWSVLRLNPLDCVTPEEDLPCVEVSAVDCTQERWTWAKVVDAYTYPEEVWRTKYAAKFQGDCRPLRRKQTRSNRRKMSMGVAEDEPKEEESQESQFDVLTQYNTLTKPLRIPFRRRTFNTLALDEHNTIRPLTSFVRPITMHDDGIVTPQQAAIAVSRIPYHLPSVPRSELSRKLASAKLSADEEEQLGIAGNASGGGVNGLSSDLSDGCGLAGWALRYSSHLLATENFYAQICSPQTMLLSRRGSLIEHAILLCGLFLGMGYQAYVAIGKITINRVEDPDEQDALDEFSTPSTIEFEPTGGGKPITFRRGDFKKIKEAMEAKESNQRFRVVHWDAITGMTFDDPSTKGFFFERLETLFNHQNIFFNVQNSDLLN
ncbi:hypothetical protein HDU96_003632, partial [Phlyctochytrium bullatum]